MGSFSIWHWLVVLAVVLVVFGSKHLRTLGSDLGTSIRGFRDAMKEGSEQQARQDSAKPEALNTQASSAQSAAEQKDKQT